MTCDLSKLNFFKDLLGKNNCVDRKKANYVK